MQIFFVAFIIVAPLTAYADDLKALKAAAVRYVAAMKAVLALPEALDCSKTIAKAGK